MPWVPGMRPLRGPGAQSLEEGQQPWILSSRGPGEAVFTDCRICSRPPEFAYLFKVSVRLFGGKELSTNN